MTAIQVAVILVFGIPIMGLSMLFAHEARRMMRAEEDRARIRAAAMQARRCEAARRKARGTPRRRPGGYAIR